MLKVEVMGEDGHITTIAIDSVLEVPQKGTSYTCGRCGKETKVKNVSIPYRDDSNGKNNHVDNGQESVLK